MLIITDAFSIPLWKDLFTRVRKHCQRMPIGALCRRSESVYECVSVHQCVSSYGFTQKHNSHVGNNCACLCSWQQIIIEKLRRKYLLDLTIHSNVILCTSSIGVTYACTTNQMWAYSVNTTNGCRVWWNSSNSLRVDGRMRVSSYWAATLLVSNRPLLCEDVSHSWKTQPQKAYPFCDNRTRSKYLEGQQNLKNEIL